MFKNLLLNWRAKRVRFDSNVSFLSQASKADVAICRHVANFTMTGLARSIATIQSARHVIRSKIPGDFVECGVWRGGSMMAIALALMEEGDTERELFLFDTFAGMTKPSSVDKTRFGFSAKRILAQYRKGTGPWCFESFYKVRANMESTGYPMHRVHFIEGAVEMTLPAHTPKKIAMLRLDTDWYESTRHELVHLYPSLQNGGVLIIDDYGHWRGAKKAVDEYFADNPPALTALDYTGRLLVR